ncbi:MAG: T9SS type A sorting domain-containing protein [Bacteroidota bacterium]
MYPNPASYEITIRVEDSNQSGVAVYSIHNLTGQTLSSGDLNLEMDKEATIDVSKLKGGIYIVRVLMGGKISTKKV